MNLPLLCTVALNTVLNLSSAKVKRCRSKWSFRAMQLAFILSKAKARELAPVDS